jgi:hypothetical protein
VIGCQGTSLVGFRVFVCPSFNFPSKQATHLLPFHRPALTRTGAAAVSRDRRESCYSTKAPQLHLRWCPSVFPGIVMFSRRLFTSFFAQRAHSPKCSLPSTCTHTRFFAHPIFSCRLASRVFSPRKLPPQVAFAKHLLNKPAAQLVSATDNRDVLDKYRADVFSDLHLDPPQKLPETFPDLHTYKKMLSSLVAEEALQTIIVDLGKLLDGIQDGRKRQRDGIRIFVTEMDESFHSCYTYKPLTKLARKEIKAGTVVLLVQEGLPATPENISFGIVQYGSQGPVEREYFVLLDLELANDLPYACIFQSRHQCSRRKTKKSKQ